MRYFVAFWGVFDLLIGVRLHTSGDVVGRVASWGRQGNLRLGSVDSYSEPFGFGKDFLKLLTKWATELRTLTDFVRQEEVMACRPVADRTQEENVTEWG